MKYHIFNEISGSHRYFDKQNTSDTKEYILNLHLENFKCNKQKIKIKKNPGKINIVMMMSELQLFLECVMAGRAYEK